MDHFIHRFNLDLLIINVIGHYKFIFKISMGLCSSGRALALIMVRERVQTFIKALWGLVLVLIQLSNN